MDIIARSGFSEEFYRSTIYNEPDNCDSSLRFDYMAERSKELIAHMSGTSKHRVFMFLTKYIKYVFRTNTEGEHLPLVTGSRKPFLRQFAVDRFLISLIWSLRSNNTVYDGISMPRRIGDRLMVPRAFADIVGAPLAHVGPLAWFASNGQMFDSIMSNAGVARKPSSVYERRKYIRENPMKRFRSVGSTLYYYNFSAEPNAEDTSRVIEFFRGQSIRDRVPYLVRFCDIVILMFKGRAMCSPVIPSTLIPTRGFSLNYGDIPEIIDDAYWNIFPSESYQRIVLD
jgi:hypothetical protein